MPHSYEKLAQIAQDNHDKIFRAEHVIDPLIAAQVLQVADLSYGENLDTKTEMFVNLVKQSDPEEIEKYATIYPDHVLAVLLYEIKPYGHQRLSLIARSRNLTLCYDPLSIGEQIVNANLDEQLVAESTGIKQEKIAKWINATEIPDAMDLSLLAAELGVSVQKFYISRKYNKDLKHIDDVANYADEPKLTNIQKKTFLALEAIYNNADHQISKSELLEMIRRQSLPGLESISESSFYRFLNIFKQEGLIVHERGFDNPIHFTQRGRDVRPD